LHSRKSRFLAPSSLQSLAERLNEIKAPVTIVVGELDTDAIEQAPQWEKDISDSMVIVVEGANHYLWQNALGQKSNATLKLYPRLVRLFIAGEGPSTPQEYLVEGHVSDEVIQDIARWIRK